MKKNTFVLVILSLFVFSANFAHASPKHNAVSPDESGPERVARVNGFTKCASAIKEANRVVFGDGKYNYFTSWNKNDANNHSFNVQGVRTFTDGNTFATYTVTPNVKGTCEIQIHTVFPYNVSCQYARVNYYKDWMLQSTVVNGVSYLTYNGMELFLFSQDTGGCVAIKTELVSNN